MVAIWSIAVAAYGTSSSVLALAPAVGFSVLLVAILRWGVSSLLFVTMAGAALTAPMNGLKFGGLATLSDVLFFTAAFLLTLSRLSAPSGTYIGRFQPVLMPAAVIVLGGLVGTFFTAEATTSLVELTKFALSTIGLFLLVAVWAADHRQLRVLAWMFTAGSSLSVLAGLTLLRDAFGRAQGFTLHPNHLGLVSLMASGAALGLALTSGGGRRKVALACGLVLVVGVVMSGSRAALAGGGAFFLTYLLATRNWSVLRWAALAAVACTALLSLGIVKVTADNNAVGRFLGKDTTSAESDSIRASLRARTLERIDAHPITGDGFARARSSHNLYLQLWASAGLLGLLGFLGIVLVVIRIAVSRPRPDPLVMAMLTSYIGYLFAAYASTVYWDRFVWVHLALTLGLFVTTRGQNQNGSAGILLEAATVRRARLQAASPRGALRTTQ